MRDAIAAVRKSFGEMIAVGSGATLGLSIWPVSEDNSLQLTMSLIVLVFIFLNAPLFILDIACNSSAAGESRSNHTDAEAQPCLRQLKVYSDSHYTAMRHTGSIRLMYFPGIRTL